MLSAALWQTGESENFFGEYSTKLPEMHRAFWGQAVRNMYMFQEFEMAYLVRAQMHKRQVPRNAGESSSERRVAVEVETLSQQEKAELRQKIRRQRGISKEHK